MYRFWAWIIKFIECLNKKAIKLQKIIIKKGKRQMKKVKEQRNKNEKAITLIALAVTIIALLILAGVAISLSIGNNGVVSRGQVSTEGNKLASYKEKVEMYKAEKLMEDEKFIEETLSA